MKRACNLNFFLIEVRSLKYRSLFSLMESLEQLAKFTQNICKLKQTKRTGWTVYKEIEHVESVADHSYRMALLCMVFAKPAGVDLDRSIKMSLMHDLAEAVTGDIAPF